MKKLFSDLKKICSDNNVTVWTTQQLRRPYSPPQRVMDSDIVIIDYMDHLTMKEEEDGI